MLLRILLSPREGKTNKSQLHVIYNVILRVWQINIFKPTYSLLNRHLHRDPMCLSLLTLDRFRTKAWMRVWKVRKSSLRMSTAFFARVSTKAAVARDIIPCFTKDKACQYHLCKLYLSTPAERTRIKR